MTFRAWTAEASGACSKIHGPVRNGERRNASSGSCYVKQHTFNQEIVRTLFGSRSKEIEGGKKMSLLRKSGHWVIHDIKELLLICLGVRMVSLCF